MSAVEPTHLASIDLEDWYADVESVPGSPSNDSEEAFHRQVDVLLDILARTKTAATFFVLGRTAVRYPQVARAIRDAGHEIASHGFGHERIDALTPETFDRDLAESLDAIERVTGVRPRGYRAPYFSVRREDLPWFYATLARHGVVYSSSVFPFGGRRYGIKDHSLEPNRVEVEGGRSLHEVPLSVLSWRQLRVPVAGGGFWRLLPKSAILWSTRRLQAQGRPLVMYLHPHEFDPQSLRSHRGGLRNAYVNLGRRSVRGKFEALLGAFRFQPLLPWVERQP